MNALKLLAAILALAAAGLGYSLRQQQAASHAEIEALKVAHAAALAAKHAEMQSALGAQADQHQSEIQALNAGFETKLADMQRSQRDQMAAAYREFENVFDGNKKTIDYINLLEGKVKAGQEISKAEVERLAIIASGIGYLQKQYQKPLDQFSELAGYFEKQAALQPEKPKGSFFRRLFSKEYKEAEREFNREQGMKQAYEEAQSKFTTVYRAAQKQMAAVNIDAEAQVKKLYSLIEDKEQANKENLTGFFNQARQALRTHQDVLKFEPENLPPTVPRPQ